MIEVGLSLLLLPPQATERIDFDLEPGVILVAALAFVLINLLIAAALYPYLNSSSSGGQETGATAEMAPGGEMVDETLPDDSESMDERVDEFLEEIEQSG